MKRFSLPYFLITYRLDLLWFPLAFWVLFVGVSLVLREPNRVTDTARAFLGVVLPLIGGIMAAFSILSDPALELRFSTPLSAARTLLERLGLPLLILTVAAFSFQVLIQAIGGDLTLLGSWFDMQLAWLVPLLSLMALGCTASLVAAEPMGGVLTAGILWLLELLGYDWLAGNSGRYVLVFMGTVRPAHPALHVNQAVLLSLSALLFLAAWALLHRQERFI